MSNENHRPRLRIMAREKKITIGEREFLVGELGWLDMFEFLKKTSSHAGKLTGPDGKVNLDPERIAGLVTHSEELGKFLITHATTITDGDLDNMPFDAALDILDAALEINLSPEILDKAKKVAGRFMLGLGGKAAASTPKSESSEQSTS